MAARRPARRLSEAGMTMMEVMIMGVIMAILMVMITESVAGLSKTRIEHKTHAQVGDVSDRVARAIERDAGHASRIFTAGADSAAYLASLNVAAGRIATGSRLPALTDRGYFDRDPVGTPETGNILFLGVHAQTVGVNIQDDGGILSITSGGGSAELFLVETHVFVLYHVSLTAEGKRDLVRWQSVPMANYWDVEQVEDPDRKQAILSELYSADIRYAWDPTMPRSGGLYEILPAGAMQLLPMTEKVPCAFPRGGKPIFGSRHMEIAANDSLQGLQVPAFAQPDASTGFPAAFEIKIDGTAGGKLLLLRMVTRSTLPTPRPVFTEIRRFVACNG